MPGESLRPLGAGKDPITLTPRLLTDVSGVECCCSAHYGCAGCCYDSSIWTRGYGQSICCPTHKDGTPSGQGSFIENGYWTTIGEELEWTGTKWERFTAGDYRGTQNGSSLTKHLNITPPRCQLWLQIDLLNKTWSPGSGWFVDDDLTAVLHKFDWMSSPETGADPEQQIWQAHGKPDSNSWWPFGSFTGPKYPVEKYITQNFHIGPEACGGGVRIGWTWDHEYRGGNNERLRSRGTADSGFSVRHPVDGCNFDDGCKNCP